MLRDQPFLDYKLATLTVDEVVQGVSQVAAASTLEVVDILNLGKKKLPKWSNVAFPNLLLVVQASNVDLPKDAFDKDVNAHRKTSEPVFAQVPPYFKMIFIREWF